MSPPQVSRGGYLLRPELMLWTAQLPNPRSPAGAAAFWGGPLGRQGSPNRNPRPYEVLADEVIE
jgi:hypothetical protein